VLRLGLAVLQDGGVPAGEASLLLDRVLAAGLHLFARTPSWAAEHAEPGGVSGNGPGVCRARGRWVVLPSWVGTGAQPSRITQVHVLLQLGVCLQLKLTLRG